MNSPASLRTALLALALACGACSSTGGREGSERLEALWEENLADAGDDDPAGQAEVEARRAARVAEVRELVERSDSSLTAEQRLFAAAVLLDASDPLDLRLAERLALDAAAAGEERGFPLAAEAIDRQCLVLGLPQRYGTQYVWSPASGRWSLYPTDPATSDVERRAMGVPELAEAIARAEELGD